MESIDIALEDNSVLLDDRQGSFHESNTTWEFDITISNTRKRSSGNIVFLNANFGQPIQGLKLAFCWGLDI